MTQAEVEFKKSKKKKKKGKKHTRKVRLRHKPSAWLTLRQMLTADDLLADPVKEVKWDDVYHHDDSCRKQVRTSDQGKEERASGLFGGGTR